MPQTNFGLAILDGVRQILERNTLTPSQLYSLDALRFHNSDCDVTYQLRIHQMPGAMEMPVRDFLTLTPVDISVLDQLVIPKHGRVADLGCGIGRHLAYIRHRFPETECCGVEHCDLLRSFAAENFPGPKRFVANMEELEGDFDAIFMLGNGLGILGDNIGITEGLKTWRRRLKPDGYLVIETGTFSGRSFDEITVSTSYRGLHDSSLAWYGASQRCLLDLLQTPDAAGTNLQVNIRPSRNHFFIATAQRR